MLIFFGIALLLGGVVHAMASIPLLNDSDPASLTGNLRNSLRLSFAFSYLLIGMGVIGLQLQQGEQWGGLGLAGIVLASIGSLLTMTISFVFANVAKYQKDIQSPTDLLGPIFILLPGFIITGNEAIGTGVFPPMAGWLVMLGVVLCQPFGRLAILRSIGGVLFGAGLAWLGWSLLGM